MNTVVESVVSSSEVAQTKPKKELHPTWRSLLIFALVLSVVWLFISLGLFILCATVVRGAALLLILLPITITVIHFLNIFLISKNLKSNEVKYLSGLPVLWFFTLFIPGIIIAIIAWVNTREIKEYQHRQG